LEEIQRGDNVSASPADVVSEDGVPQNPDNTDVIGRRVVAALIDIGLMFGLFWVLALTIGETISTSTFSNTETTYETAYVLSPGQAFAYIVLVLLYFFTFEAAFGRTLGKRLLGLRVMAHDGTPARPRAIATRTLLRLIDWLPFFNLVGFICLLATGRRHQRLGDLVAKTVVIRQ
jgi:uncharacterized RDD family membrane protein YckC